MNLKVKYLFYFVLLSFIFNCNKENIEQKNIEIKSKNAEIPEKNKQVVSIAKKYGNQISPTYEKAVCTEFVIQVLEKLENLNEVDKSRIRIITNENIQELLRGNSQIPKGVYYALTEKGIGIPINHLNEVCEGDFVQFWTESWGHCGIVKNLNLKDKTMQLYSSFPSTNGYGIQNFDIPKHTYFVRLK